MDAIKKRNALLAKYQAKITELQEEKSHLEADLRRNKKQGSEREDELEGQLKADREKARQAHLAHE